MDADLQSLIIAIAGIVATLISSGLGLYFTARARTAPLREMLYREQITLSLRIARIMGRIKLIPPILLDPDEDKYDEEAIDDLRSKVHEMSLIVDDAASLLPTDVFVEVSQFSQATADFLLAYETGNDTEHFRDTINGEQPRRYLS